MMGQMSWIDRVGEGRLTIMPRPAGGPDLESSLEELAAQQIGVIVSLLTLFEEVELGLEEEASLCNSVGIEFVSFPIPDRGLPESAQAVQKLVELVSVRLTEGKSVAIHCRMGIGRSGMIAACILAHQGLEVMKAFEAIGQARGVKVPDTAEQRAWVERFASNS